ncbi:MAG: hypothetical protein K2X35_08830 [Bryobacteraceae bacterium]|nr:hypothetical protein [Bryobacteraceae bacterium]
MPAATVSRLTLILISPLLVPAQVPDRKAQALAHAADVFTSVQRLSDRNIALRTAAALAAEVCKYDQPAGVNLFQQARLIFPPAANVPWYIGDRGFLRSLALACDPALQADFGETSPTSQARTDLAAALAAVRGSELPAADLPQVLQRAASGLPLHDRPGMLALMDVLQQVRMRSPEQANAAFLQAAGSLTNVAPESAIQGLYTLATYLFQAPGQNDPRSVIVRPLEGGGSAYYFSQVRAGIPADLVAAYLRIAAPRLALMTATGTVQTRRQALAHQLLPLAGRYHPASIADLQTAAGLKTGVEITPEVQALLRPVDLSKPDFEKDLAAKAEDELDAERKDELHLSLLIFLIQSNRLKDALDILPKIGNNSLRRAMAGLVAFRQAEEALASSRPDDALQRVAAAPDPVYPAILSLALAALPDAETAGRLGVCLDFVNKADPAHRAPLLAGVASLMASAKPEFGLEILREAVLQANQSLRPPRRPEDRDPVLSVTSDPRGFLATVEFRGRKQEFRLQPKGLPALAFTDVIRAFRRADPVVLAEIAGKLDDENSRARAITAVVAAELEQAFRPESQPAPGR